MQQNLIKYYISFFVFLSNSELTLNFEENIILPLHFIFYFFPSFQMNESLYAILLQKINVKIQGIHISKVAMIFK